MSAMGDIPMSGGWTMSMMWMPTCGQTWLGTATDFIGMWSAMTVAMMLPVLMPMLWSYREAVARVTWMRATALTALAGLGYFAVWVLLGIAVFACGAVAMQIFLRQATLARAVPYAGGAVVLIAGALQFSAWKARWLACCRTTPECDCDPPASIRGAWRHGLRLGLRCIGCCANLTAVLIVVDVMDLRMMALATMAVSAERLAADGEYVACISGAVAVGAGLSLFAQAALRLG